MSIADWVHGWADTDQVAIRFEGHTVTYAALASRIDDAAAGLVAAGVSAGDRVAYCGLNRVELFEALFACARVGAIFLPLNNRLTAAELATQVDDSDPGLIVTTDGFAKTMTQAAGGRLVRDLDLFPFERDVEVGAETAAAVEPTTPVLMVYTSGTTGSPKGAMLSHDAILHTVLNSIEHQRFTSRDRIVAPLPTFHVGGLNIQVLPMFFIGGEVLLQRRFDPAGVLELIAKHRPTQTLLVPAMLAAVAAEPAFASTDLSCLVGINSGSSTVPLAVMKPFFDRGIPVGQVYGTTETGPTAVVLDYADAADHVGSCGRPAAHTELRIVDESDRAVGDGEVGEIQLRGPHIFSGYWRASEATDTAFAAGGWFRTGDVGHRDAEGFLHISDRIKDVIISGGENIYPAELELVLAEHPEILEVAVVGRPHQRWGEVAVAVVVTGGAPISAAEIIDWCDGRVARFKQPHDVVVVDSLPRTALGKVQKHLLRSQIADTLG